MAFVGFAPAFNQAFQQSQRNRQSQQLQEQQAEQRLAELQKRFELQAQLPSAQERLAQGFATNPELRQLLEFQADPLGLKSRGLDIQEQAAEARLKQLSPDFQRPTSQQKNFNFLLQQEVENFRRKTGRGPTNEEMEKLFNQARDIAFREDPFSSLQRAIFQGGPSPKPTNLNEK